MDKKENVCVLLDKLTLEMLCLIEQEIQCKLNIEKITKDAIVELARARYMNGQHTVSALQLPAENCTPFSALSTVIESQYREELSENFDLNLRQVDKDKGEVDPIKWFGVLVPQSLHTAQKLFKKALTYIVECRNIQAKLSNILYNINGLNTMKKTL